MSCLEEQIMRLSNAKVLGGRVQKIDSRTVEILDCMRWDRSSMERLRSHFPDVEISVHSDRHSLSGFKIVFYAGASGREGRLYVVIGLILACCMYTLIRPPWWTAYGSFLNI
jgi:hypothetical protein